MTEALWTYKREPAGMGEWCYRVYRNGVYWFYLEDSDQAMIVVNALNRDSSAKSDAVLDGFCYPDCALFEKKGCPHPGHGVNITHCEAFQEKWYYSDTKVTTLSRFKTQANDILQRVERIRKCKGIDKGLFDLMGIQFDAERILEVANGSELRSQQKER